mgnify:FL=1|jgi:hypothetical protein
MTSKIVNKKFNDDESMFSLTIITTDNGICEFSVSKEFLCCEYFGLVLGNKETKTCDVFDPLASNGERVIDKQTLDQLKGNIISIKYLHNQNIPDFLSQFEDSRIGDMNSYFNEIITTEGTFYVGIFNEHNGYYSHTYEVKWNNIDGVDDYVNEGTF